MASKKIPRKLQRQLANESMRKHPLVVLKGPRTTPPSESGKFELWTLDDSRKIAPPFKTKRKALEFADQYFEAVRMDKKPKKVPRAEIEAAFPGVDDY